MNWPIERITQEYERHDGAKVIGDCLRASVASLFGFGLHDVPHFASLGLDAPDDDPIRHAWWFTLVGWAACLEPPFDVIRIDPADPPEPDDDPLGGCYLLTGPSPRGDWNHTVVARAGEIVWDPHPSRAGLAGPAVAAERFVERRHPVVHTAPEEDAA